jgi:transcriptional regulator with XRE-family HTH domain
MSQVSKRLKEIRTKSNLTQKDVASRSGLSLRNYQNYERGKCEPNADNLIALANCYFTSIDYLVGGTGSDNPEMYHFLSFKKQYEDVTTGDDFGHVCVISYDPGWDAVCIFLCDDCTPRKCAGHFILYRETDDNWNMVEFIKLIEYLEQQNCKVEINLNWYTEWNEMWRAKEARRKERAAKAKEASQKRAAKAKKKS